MAEASGEMNVITSEGKQVLSRLVEACRNELGVTWGQFHEYVVVQSGIQMSFDVLYRAAGGNYRLQPNLSAIAGLGAVKELRFFKKPGEKVNLTLGVDGVMDVLLGRVDAYGNAIKSSVINHN